MGENETEATPLRRWWWPDAVLHNPLTSFHFTVVVPSLLSPALQADVLHDSFCHLFVATSQAIAHIVPPSDLSIFVQVLILLLKCFILLLPLVDLSEPILVHHQKQIAPSSK